MKKLFLYAAATVLLGGLAACSNEQDMMSNVPENAVRIEAAVGNFSSTRSNPVGTAEEQAQFNVGDSIQVIQGGMNRVTYVKTANGWEGKDGKYLLWENEVHNFTAFYPSKDIVESGNMLLDNLKDQSTLEKISACDFMEGGVRDAKKADGPVRFEMKRLNSRIIIQIAGFNNQFAENEKVVSNVQCAAYWDSKDNSIGILSGTMKPYVQGSGVKGTTYTVLTDKIFSMSATLTVAGKELKVNLPFPKDSTQYQTGKSYTYNLTVGKNKVEVGEVLVEDWAGKSVIPDGDTNEKSVLVDTLTHNLYVIIPGTLTVADIVNAVGSSHRLHIGGKLNGNDILSFNTWKNKQTNGRSPNAQRLTLISFQDIIEIDNKPFTTLWEDACLGMGNLQIVIVPSDLENISTRAFNGCNHLSVISKPKVLKKIGDYAFAACSSLDFSSLDLSQVETLGKESFLNCERLGQVNMPKVKALFESEFQGCIHLVSAELAGVTQLAKLVFADCSELATLKLTAKGEFTVDPDAFVGLTTTNVDLTLNVDKKPGSTLASAVKADGTWAGKSWKSITYVDDNGKIVS